MSTLFHVNTENVTSSCPNQYKSSQIIAVNTNVKFTSQYNNLVNLIFSQFEVFIKLILRISIEPINTLNVRLIMDSNYITNAEKLVCSKLFTANIDLNI